ncbi:MAG: hypothetical protein ACFBSF_01955 [Leptolyngbyaceae cyanobacterium]
MKKTGQSRSGLGRLGLAWTGTAIALMITAFTGLGFLGSFWWGLGLLEHWRGQYCWILLICIGVLMSVRVRRAILWLIPLSINLVVVGTLYWPAPAAPAIHSPSLRILHFNLDRHNPKTDEVLQYLDAQTVDLLSLQEVTPKWARQLGRVIN